MPIQGHIYCHYKGSEYTVLYIGRHTETEEEMVVYCAVLSPEKIWIRPLSMFMEHVSVEGKCVPRFKHVKIK